MTRLGRFLCLASLIVVWSGPSFAQDGDPPELPKTDSIPPDSVEPALGRAFGARDGFCKNGGHDLSKSEAALCDLAPAGSKRCPGFAKACEQYAAERDKQVRPSAGSGTGSERERANRRRRHASGRGREDGEGAPDDRSAEDSPSFEASSSPFGNALGSVITAIVWALLALGIGAMLVAAIRAILNRRKKDELAPESKGSAAVERVQKPLVTGSPEELLERARGLARAGELKAATAIVLRALLRQLEIGGALELHPSRTNGDYVRSLRRRGHRPDDLRTVAAAVEAIEFGGQTPSAEGFSALYARVSKLIEVASVTLLCLSLGLLTGCQKRPPPSENKMASCGIGASGYSALCEALAARGVKVHRRFASVEKVAHDVTRVVVLEDELDDAERSMLLAWAARGGTLVVFDPSNAYIGTESKLESECGEELTLEPTYFGVPPEAKHRFRLPGARSFAEQGASHVAVRCGTRPFVLESSRGVGSIVAIADARLPMNASFAVEQNAALVTTLIGPPGSSVELVGGWTGSGTDLPLESLLRSGLLPWFLHILLLGLALALYRGSPFGTRREPATVTRRAFAEHAIALGDAYSRVRASRIALMNFGSYALERLRVRLQATKHGRLTDLAGAVAARHGVSESEVMGLVVAVRSAEDPAHDSATEVEHLAALRRLAALVKKTGGTS